MGKPYTEFQKGLAFDAYFGMGEARELSILGRYLVDTQKEHFPNGAPAHPTLKKWSSRENWKARIIQREIEINRKVEANTDYQIVKAVVNTKADYRTSIANKLEETDKLIQRLTTLVAKVSPRIAKGSGQDDGQPDSDTIKELKIDTIKELNEVLQTSVKLEAVRLQLVKADLVIMGEADSRTEHAISLAELVRYGRKKNEEERDRA